MTFDQFMDEIILWQTRSSREFSRGLIRDFVDTQWAVNSMPITHLMPVLQMLMLNELRAMANTLTTVESLLKRADERAMDRP